MRWMAAILTLLFADRAYGQDETVGVRFREWFERLHGTIESSEAPLNGSTVNLVDDLGLGSQHRAPEVEAYLKLPVVGRLMVGAWWVRDEGVETLTRSINFAGQTFTQSDRITSHVSLETYYLTYQFDFPTIPIGSLLKVELGAQVGARILRGHGSIQDTQGNNGSDGGTVGLPVLGGHVAIDVAGWVRAEAELIGLAVALGGYHASYLEANAELDITPLPWLFAGVGYKLVDLHARHGGSTNFDLDAELKGLYLTAGLRF